MFRCLLRSKRMDLKSARRQNDRWREMRSGGGSWMELGNEMEGSGVLFGWGNGQFDVNGRVVFVGHSPDQCKWQLLSTK
jgi:hypothetical protein